MTIKYYDAIHDKDLAYWDIGCLNKLLSHKADAYVTQSPRNYGKSYSAMELAKKQIEKGESIAWGRYNKPEMGQAYNTLLDHLPNMVPLKVPDSPFKWLEDECTNGRICVFNWSISQNAKGMDYPFTHMICDEFIPERYTNMTRMDTEFNDWDSVRKSIVRSYGTKVLLLSNNIYWQNPFFLHWGIPPFGKGKILKKTDTMIGSIDGEQIKETRTIVVENVAGTPAIIKRNIRESLLSFSSTAEMQRYFDNETKQEYTTIANCPDRTVDLEPFRMMTEGYYFGLRVYDGLYYWAKVKPDFTVNTYVAEPSYVDYSKRHIRDPGLSPTLEDWFNKGRCCFDSADTLQAFYRYLRKCRARIS